MNEVSPFRLYVLRAMYLFIVVGLGVYLWPGVLDPSKRWELMQGQASCMLAAFSLLCVLGLRYPLQMLPADDFCHFPGGARLFGDSLALRVRALHQGAGGAVALVPGVDPPSTSDLYR